MGEIERSLRRRMLLPIMKKEELVIEVADGSDGEDGQELVSSDKTDIVIDNNSDFVNVNAKNKEQCYEIKPARENRTITLQST